MKRTKEQLLVINCGSSSIKFAMYETSDVPNETLTGRIENIGTRNIEFSYIDCSVNQRQHVKIDVVAHNDVADFLVTWLGKQIDFAVVKAIGHRIVHGMQHAAPALVTPELLAELKTITAYDPEHLPQEIKLIELFGSSYPSLPQVACFDTGFHANMPLKAKQLAIPRRYYERGIRRYGFHGISYAYLMEELKQIGSEEEWKGKVILAHLGSGASLAAVSAGKSVDTSMGFTPASGLVMGSRTGDLDPGVAWYLMQSEQLNPKQFNHLINHDSGLLGISEISSDMRELMKVKDTDNRAAEAIELFCYQTKKWIGAFAAALAGVDTLVFSGGIGENIAEVRSRICEGMKFLGIEINTVRNEKDESIISTETSNVTVRVIKTNEEVMIARMVIAITNN